MFLRRIILSKSSPLTNRNFCSVTAATLARYPLGRDFCELENYKDNHDSIRSRRCGLFLSDLNYKDNHDNSLLDIERPVSLQYRVKTMIELSDLDGAAKLARLSAVRPDNHTLDICNTVIKAMCNSKRDLEGISLFHYFFNKLKIVPNIESFNLVIKAFRDLGYGDDALQLYRHASKFGADKETYRLLTEAMINTYGVDEAWDFYVETPCTKEEMLMCILIRGEVNDIADDEKCVDLYFEKQRLEFNGKVFNSIATIFVEYWFKRGNEEKAMECYNCITTWTCSNLRVTTGNTLLEILLANGKKDEAWALFNKMMMNANSFDSETVNVMVNECFKLGEFKEAMETFNKSQEKKRMVGCYSNMVARLCEHGMVSEAEPLFEKMCSSDDKDLLSPDISAFRSMVGGYVRVGRVDDALKTSRRLAILNLSKVSIYQDPR